MNKIVVLAVAFSVAFLSGCGPSDTEKADAQMKEITDGMKAETARIQADSIKSGGHILELTHGRLAGEEYVMCHTYKPTQPKNIKRCQQLDQWLKEEMAKPSTW